MLNEINESAFPLLLSSDLVSLIESLSLLRRLVVDNANPLDDNVLCDKICQAFIQQREIDCCAMYLLDGDVMDCRAVYCQQGDDPPTRAPDAWPFQQRDNLARRIAEAHAELDSGVDYLIERDNLTLSVSLGHGSNVHGAVVLRYSSSTEYQPWHRQLLRLSADIAAQSIIGNRCLRDMRQALALRDQELAQIDMTLRGESQLRLSAESALRQVLQGRGNQALYDPLTGLMIRETFTGKIQSAVKRARSLGECSALLMLDLDHFHVINDVAGHSAGDRLLKAIANLLQEKLFEEKECARLGSDEFVILLHNMDADEVQAQAHRLRNEIDALIFESNNQRFAISASIGVVPITSNSPDSAELIRMAYSACRCAQEENCGVRLFMDNDARIQRRHNEARMLGWVLKAIESGQIELYCQPIVGPQVSCTSLSGEILLRMRNGQGQLISAGELMLLAERHGFSSKLDRLVVTRTLQILSSEQSALDGIRYLAINLSAHSIGNVAFVDFLAEQIRQSGVDGSKLCFEITETAAILDLKATGHLIDMLKGLGCKFALDDFGSGHASYLYLRDLAVDYLKIDGEFIRHMVTDPVNIDLVRAMLDMGKILGKEVIAEFVENNATLKLLEELGMDWVQGYFIGRPMPLLEFLVDQKP